MQPKSVTNWLWLSHKCQRARAQSKRERQKQLCKDKPHMRQRSNESEREHWSSRHKQTVVVCRHCQRQIQMKFKVQRNWRSVSAKQPTTNNTHVERGTRQRRDVSFLCSVASSIVGARICQTYSIEFLVVSVVQWVRVPHCIQFPVQLPVYHRHSFKTRSPRTGKSSSSSSLWFGLSRRKVNKWKILLN